MKKKITSAVLTIVLCLSLIAGSTYALFTSEDTVNIAVTSGKVNVVATITEEKPATTSLGVEQTPGSFANGGSAQFTSTESGKVLTLSNMTPGDATTFTIQVTNNSTVTIQYRLVWAIEGELAQYLTATADNQKITNYVTEWKTWTPGDEIVKNIAVAVTLPADVGNVAQDKEATISFKVEAVQGNGVGALGGTQYVETVAGLNAALANGGNIVLSQDIELTEGLHISAGTTVVLDMNGKTLSSASAIDAPMIYNRGVLELKNGTINAVETTAIRNHGSTAELTLTDMTVSQVTAVNPEWQGSAVFTSGGGTTVINSGNYSGVSSAAIVATSGGHLIINGGIFTANVTTIRVDTWSYNSFLTINDGTFNVSVDGAKALYADGYKKDININGGTFNGTIDSTYTTININRGIFTKSIKQSGGHQNHYVINGGTFVDDLRVSISKNTQVMHAVTDNGNGTYTVAITADEAKELIAAGGNVALVGTIDMGGETVNIPNGTTISGGAIQNATLNVADDYNVSFDNVEFDNTVAIKAAGDGSLNLTDCTFNVTPEKNGFSRAGAIIGTNQYYTIDLKLDGCTFNYQYNAGDADLYNNAIFMWSNVKSCEIKNCTFNGYGFVAVKLMNVVEGAEILFEGNTFNMSKEGDSNYWYNNAIQIVPQHDNSFTAKFINNTFTGDYEDGKIVAWIDGMSNLTLTKHTIIHNGNTINGETVTDDNFAINPN